MFTFSVVKKIGEGNYLTDDLFIIERIRRERALNIRRMRTEDNRRRTKTPPKDEKHRPS